jgi:PAS domain S-box-containing protein
MRRSRVGPAVVPRVARRRRTEEALRKTNEALEGIIRSSPAAIITLDCDGYVKVWNPAAEHIFGWTADEAVGQLNPIVPADKIPAFLDMHRKVLAGLTLVGMEAWRLRKDGTPVYVSLSTALTHDAAGTVDGVVGIILDVTEKKRAEEQIRELNASLELRVIERTRELQEAIGDLEAFSYSVAHDLRAPLRAIEGFSAALLDDHAASLDEEGLDFLQTICRNTQRMNQLIDDLLEFSRLGRKEMSFVPVQMNGLVAEVIEDLMPLHVGRSFDFAIADLPVLAVDRSMFRQVLTNLISNAMKFTGRVALPRIEIGTERTDTEVVCWVRDNGAGFDMQFKEKLFGVFQRLHSETSFKGTGVGLAIVARVVSRHGGRVWAEGEVDQGACFWLALPLERLVQG